MMSYINYLSIPKMGESVSEATIVRWLKNIGDTVQKDEPFIEISTDKVESEIPAPFACKIVEILYPNDSTVKVNIPIAKVETKKEEAGAPQMDISQNSENKLFANNSKANLTQTESAQKSNTYSEKSLSPLVKKMLFKNNIPDSELKYIVGSGNEGRITAKDAENYIQNRKHHIENQPFPIHNQPNPSQSNELYKEENPEAGDEVIKFDRMRTLIAKHMSQSKLASAHCTSFAEIDVTDLVAFRDQNKESFQAQHGQKLTYTHLMMWCCVRALADFPKLNAHSIPNGYLLKKNINLGFAALTPDDNLIVPNIKMAENLPFVDLVSAVNTMADKAKTSQLSPEDTQNGTFTLSNTGIFGSMMGTPIINQPQVAIMSLGEITKQPAVVETPHGDRIEIRKMMMASLSYDHRIIDGAYAARFLKAFKTGIQKSDFREIL